MKPYKTVRIELQKGIAVFTVNPPPLNRFCDRFAEEMSDALMAAFENDAVRAIILTGTERHFIGGTDIRELVSTKSKAACLPRVMAHHRFISRIEEGPKPVLAAISGNCSRAGLEIAMACHYRIAAHGVRVGLLEVRFGLIPGLGGTQRLPRLVGIRTALEMITAARDIPVEQARQIGLVDEVVEPDQLSDKAMSAARLFMTGRLNFKIRQAGRRFDKLQGAREKKEIIAHFKDRLLKTASGYIAPFKAVEAIEQGVGLSYKTDIRLEAELYCDCLVSDVARNLIHIFLSTRNAGKCPQIRGVKPRTIRKIGIMGGGTMGAGIAAFLLMHNFEVRLWDVDDKNLRRGMDTVRQTASRHARKQKMPLSILEQRLSRQLSPALSLAAIQDVDLIIEAAPEDLEIKEKIFEAIEKTCRPDTLFSTATSVLPLARIASRLREPERLIRLHFFNPAEKMQLVEIGCTGATPDTALATVVGFARKIGKIPFLVSDGPGFYVPRQIAAILSESCFLIEAGVNPFSIDEALTEFGMPIGPAQLCDLTGLDVVCAINRHLEGALGKRWQTPALYERLYETGCYGRKTGVGWFDYTSDTPALNFRFLEVVKTWLAEKGVTPRKISREEILKQIMARSINEGAQAIAEGISDRVQEMDLAMVYGTGFPPYRGGIFRYADAWGISGVYETLVKLAAEKGPRFSPAPLLKEMAASGKNFYDD
ncbi:3-hydroxyacyl-CoA dehydrogenase [Desulfonema ishimotonii]|uniref:3-hydroxyacyl-CoA dehydrogenase n=1 Tax=Desulfonema ishimotonii TaxID=45657 RepID=A0A401FX50_9BACT|nr:3-hydroxyacyl-CoA dehydrogenase NAD-binding domain-containing protein [Desulfonema ishimotonii]GBC61582.1 3-hydroxyacyl-CoA dehydrogenase [Desulfonema ishimotonii]